MLLILFFIFINSIITENNVNGYKLGLNMIVKNEAHVILRCLESVRPIIDTWFIVDTGSTDGTQEVIKNYLKELPGELYERHWKNFKHNRNEALSLAFNKSDYVLIIDADDILEYEENFVLEPLIDDGYRIKIHHGGMIHSRPQILKNNGIWRWESIKHEYITGATCKTDIKGIKMIIIGGGDRSKNPNKFIDDAKDLEEALIEEPNNERYVFYLAQSYYDANMYEKALLNYEKRLLMGSWIEEIYISSLKISKIKEFLKFPENEIVSSYLKTYNIIPKRIEAIYYLSKYYQNQKNFLIAYSLLNFCKDFKLYENALFVDDWIYTYGLFFEQSINAYWVGHYQEAYTLNEKLLTLTIPENYRNAVVRNQQFTLSKL